MIKAQNFTYTSVVDDAYVVDIAVDDNNDDIE